MNSLRITVMSMFAASVVLVGCGGAAEEPTVVPTVAPVEEAGGPSLVDVSYAGEGSQAPTLDLYVPAGADGPYPTVLVIHGQFDNKNNLHALGDSIASEGYAAAIIDYRYPSTVSEVQSFKDVFCALGWLQAKGGEFDLDAEQVVVFGNAFGGWLAATLASSNDGSAFSGDCPHPTPSGESIQAVITYGGEFGIPQSCLSESWCLLHVGEAFGVPMTQLLGDFKPLIETSPADWGDLELSEDVAGIAETLPVSLIDGSEPPFLILHGGKDFIPTSDSEGLAKVLEEAGVSVELKIIDSASDLSIYEADPWFGELMQAISAYLAASLDG